MKVKIKKLHKDAVIPTYAKPGDAGMDLTVTSRIFDDNGNVVYGFGLAFEIPEGYAGFIFPRSSNAKKDLLLSNSVGVIDSGYRGEVMAKFKGGVNAEKSCFVSLYTMQEVYNLGDKINITDLKAFEYYEIGESAAQIIIMPVPYIDFIEADELSETERCNGGYGSTGK